MTSQNINSSHINAPISLGELIDKITILQIKKVHMKGIKLKNVDKELLAHEIAYSVVDGCGYQLDLYGDEDIDEFANYYLSLEREN